MYTDGLYTLLVHIALADIVMAYTFMVYIVITKNSSNDRSAWVRLGWRVGGGSVKKKEKSSQVAAKVAKMVAPGLYLQ